MYACRTCDLLPLLQKWNSDAELPPTAAAAAAAVLPLPGAALLSLSPNEAVLAACSGATARFYSTQQLLEGSTAELAQRQLPADVLRLAWQPGTHGQFAALLASGAVLLGNLGSAEAPAPLAAAAGVPATCLAWSLDGRQLAVGTGDEVLLFTSSGDSGAVPDVQEAWHRAASVRVQSGEMQDEDAQELEV